MIWEADTIHHVKRMIPDSKQQNWSKGTRSSPVMMNSPSTQNNGDYHHHPLQLTRGGHQDGDGNDMPPETEDQKRKQQWLSVITLACNLATA